MDWGMPIIHEDDLEILDWFWLSIALFLRHFLTFKWNSDATIV